jgi:pSer/pThr/pTyr-binding forkhead associated (FHA) protein
MHVNWRNRSISAEEEGVAGDLGGGMSSALVAVRYANGVEEEVPLKYGSNVIGKAGGPADVVLNSPALSRRHATITVGDKATDCTVEDLGSTNKTAIVTQSGDLQTLEPGTIYPLQQGSQIVMGDVQIM